MICNIHSLVDIITNSSSELFVVANEKTVETIKDLINYLLDVNEDNNLTADDLFEFELVKDVPWEEYYLEDEKPNDLPYNMKVKVTCRENIKLKEAAKILSSLTDLFEIYESCSG